MIGKYFLIKMKNIIQIMESFLKNNKKKDVDEIENSRSKMLYENYANQTS